MSAGQCRIMLSKNFLHGVLVLYLFLEDTEWPWVALVCMQMVVLMPVGIAPHQKIYVKIAPPSLINRPRPPPIANPFHLLLLLLLLLLLF